ncbi:bifunctional 2-C-methyl-D-erythritol 4-phosphate cytidylyltransferase/2-C-methyl-D-erythritol 2,4-cyclodiphosphate synthase [Sphingobium sufflavum]|nr:bifunctional 2-C-methyl-D-erythritol 4-phosphate cytidylyltransferase/2-C-methyl-D-erythritol 2,4-cyclodiphosphate synthase [Sphingobium sufflavum]MCE7797971.1 bifunctional 2-C-methyl-D-erythritol 4-phosphate cytidylyltransferase/2-C-methyl-D-erythritol 2,4-cyclodiphosphate synthase [Sphingobium sufflavum]
MGTTITTTTTITGLTAILLAAGKGERAGGGVAKQYRTLGPQSVLAHAVRSLARAERIIVVVGADAREEAEQAIGAPPASLTFITGGATRQESVRRALDHSAALPSPPSHIMVHDSARPFVPDVVWDRLVAALADGAVAAMPVLPVADTLVRGADGIAVDVVPRDALYRVQTPQAFRFDALLAAHDRWPAGSAATDDAQMVRAIGHDVRLVEGDQRLEKITMADDFARIAALNGIDGLPDIRTGTGYDVHRLVEGKPLWLCGVEIAHSHGLSGHSDADVAIHALVDAILGALAEGDIGQHFPPSDERWRGAASWQFLEFARDRVAARGGRITHVDVTIICEAPKVGPHRDAMRARLAEILAIAPDRVSVKATTTEGLGFTGRREGIAAQAVATVLLGAEG